MRVLFICTANICRSPVAERYLTHLTSRLGSGIIASSTGTMATAGYAADPIASQIAREHGVDMSGHLSRALDPEELHRADEIIVMEKRHRAWLRSYHPDVLRKVSLLRGPDGESREIIDPTGRSIATYREALGALFESIEQMALTLKYPR